MYRQFTKRINLRRRFKPGFWASVETNSYMGGIQTIGENQLIDLQRNSRIGGTLVEPFLGRYSVKVEFFILGSVGTNDTDDVTAI